MIFDHLRKPEIFSNLNVRVAIPIVVKIGEGAKKKRSLFFTNKWTPKYFVLSTRKNKAIIQLLCHIFSKHGRKYPWKKYIIQILKINLKTFSWLKGKPLSVWGGRTGVVFCHFSRHEIRTLNWCEQTTLVIFKSNLYYLQSL